MGNQQHNSTQYGAVEILNYLSGQMDRKAMHALERAALDDDLLADAIEGYKLMRETHSDEAILAKLRKINPAEKKEIAPVKKIGAFKWLSYAAAATLVIGAGWWIFSLSKPDTVLPQPKDSQMQETTVIPENRDEIVAIDPANPPDNGNLSADVIDGPKLNPKDANKKATENKKPKSVINDDLAATQKVQAAPQAESSEIVALEKPPVKAMADLEKQEQAENKAKRMLPSPAQNALKTVRNIQLLDSSDVVPVAGWESYRQFIEGNLSKMDKPTPGKAIFTIAPNGSMAKIEIEGDFSTADKQALMDSLKNGPVWKNKGTQTATAVIKWQ